MKRALVVLAIAACGEKREAPPPPPPPVPVPSIPVDAALAVDAAPPASSGAILRERPLDTPPNTLVVTPNAIYFSSLSPGVFMLRDGQTKEIDDKWVTRIMGDADAIYYVSQENDDGHLMRHPYAGDPKPLVEWDGWIQAIDDTHVYLQGFRTRTSLKVPKLGGDPLKLPCRSLAVDGDHLYCMERSEFVRYDKSGKARKVLGRVPKGRLTEGPALTAKYIYASTEGADTGNVGWSIVRVPKTGGTVEVVAPDVGNIYELVGVEHEAYWVETKHPTPRKMIVRRMGDADTEPTDFAENFGYARGIVVTPEVVFVADSEPARIVELRR
ncbi:MAG: hypothetical protein M4D80_22685 [Myxococcota bacterium]|nr:hypothetical protein [Deltaproteobacteria bacterium]MDQ3337980.1 hypothetical protein [Myxococcota bacterium]